MLMYLYLCYVITCSVKLEVMMHLFSLFCFTCSCNFVNLCICYLISICNGAADCSQCDIMLNGDKLVPYDCAV